MLRNILSNGVVLARHQQVRTRSTTIFSKLRTQKVLRFDQGGGARARCTAQKPPPVSPPAPPQPRGGKPAGSPVGWISLGLSTMVGGALLWFYSSEKERILRERQANVHGAGMPMIGGPFELLDGDGKTRTDKEFLGRYTLVYFGFTHCPDICPAELTKMANAVKILDADNEVGPEAIQPLFITIDPTRDTVKQIKSYTDEFNPRILALTGSNDKIKEVCKSYRVYFSIPEDAKQDYLVDHSIIIYLMSPEGKFVKFFGQTSSVEEMVAEIKASVTGKELP